MDNNCYLTFATTYNALRAEAALRDGDLKFKLVPVPRSISTDCGTALRCACADQAAIRNTLEQSGVEVAGSFGPAEKEQGRPDLRKGETNP